jgi:hypothetical protein
MNAEDPMNPLRPLLPLVLLGLGASSAAFGAGPAGAPSAPMQAPLCDPCLPPALRGLPAAPQTEGAALQAQVERKLRESFDAADTGKRGTLTRDEARAAGLGVVANNFDHIDAGKRGAVTFDDVKRYLRERGGKF